MQTTNETRMVPVSELPAYLRKHAPRRRMFVWVDLPNRDANGAHESRTLTTHMRVTLQSAAAWAQEVAKRSPDGHVEVVVNGSCIFIG